MRSHRATWVWDRPEPDDLVGWAVSNRVDAIFLQVPLLDPGSEPWRWSHRVVRAARRWGLRVSALNGDPGWLRQPAAAVRWRGSVEESGLFDGVHVDVEPWALPGWQEDPRPLAEAYLRLLAGMRGGGLPLEADIAFWLHMLEGPGGVPLDEAVMTGLDAVTVLSYRNRAAGPDSITGVAARALDTAARTGTPARLAVETRDLGAAPGQRKQTFHGLGARAMARELGTVDALAGRSARFNGVAVHDYTGWRALPA